MDVPAFFGMSGTFCGIFNFRESGSKPLEPTELTFSRDSHDFLPREDYEERKAGAYPGSVGSIE